MGIVLRVCSTNGLIGDKANMTYQLTEEDWIELASLAGKRDNGKPNTCHNGSVSATKSRRRHLAGLKGEIAFANIYGLDLDKKHYPSGDLGYDFLLDSGLKIDVKTRQQDSGDDLALNSDSLSSVIADVFILVHEEGVDTVSLIGWTHPLHLHCYGTVENLAGPRLLEHPYTLNEMHTLKQIMLEWEG